MIGILNAYHFDFTPGNYQERYNLNLREFLTRTFQGEPLREYKIAKGEWPLAFDECKVWVITGSSKGAYDELPWILQLKKWIQEAHAKKHKILGICFGHQIIAQALGGEVSKSSKGWGVGVKTFEIISAKQWMKPAQSKLSLLFSHQDQVISLPDGAELLAQNEFCPHQMFQIGEHILTLQGHPEFTVEFAKERMDTRQALIGEATYAKAVSSLTHPRDDQILSVWLREFSKI